MRVLHDVEAAGSPAPALHAPAAGTAARPVPLTSWNNHYQPGYNGEAFNFRQSTSDVFCLKLDGAGRRPGPVAEEAVNAVEILDRQYGAANITLLYSGGCDCEIALQSWLGYGKLPKVVFLDYGTGVNDYDKFHAVTFCKFNRIPLVIEPWDAQEMLRSGESIEVCRRFQCNQTGLSFYLKALDKFCKDSFVMAGDDPYFELLTNPLTGERKWHFYAREWSFSEWKVFIANGVDGCPNFLQYSAELWLSFIQDPIMQWMFAQDQCTSSNQVKYELYRRRFFCRPRHKSSGMERFGHLIHEQNTLLYRQHAEILGDEIQVPYDRLLQDLTKWIQ